MWGTVQHWNGNGMVKNYNAFTKNLAKAKAKPSLEDFTLDDLDEPGVTPVEQAMRALYDRADRDYMSRLPENSTWVHCGIEPLRWTPLRRRKARRV